MSVSKTIQFPFGKTSQSVLRDRLLKYKALEQLVAVSNVAAREFTVLIKRQENLVWVKIFKNGVELPTTGTGTIQNPLSMEYSELDSFRYLKAYVICKLMQFGYLFENKNFLLEQFNEQKDFERELDKQLQAMNKEVHPQAVTIEQQPTNIAIA